MPRDRAVSYRNLRKVPRVRRDGRHVWLALPGVPRETVCPYGTRGGSLEPCAPSVVHRTELGRLMFVEPLINGPEKLLRLHESGLNQPHDILPIKRKTLPLSHFWENL